METKIKIDLEEAQSLLELLGTAAQGTTTDSSPLEQLVDVDRLSEARVVCEVQSSTDNGHFEAARSRFLGEGSTAHGSDVAYLIERHDVWQRKEKARRASAAENMRTIQETLFPGAEHPLPMDGDSAPGELTDEEKEQLRAYLCGTVQTLKSLSLAGPIEGMLNKMFASFSQEVGDTIKGSGRASKAAIATGLTAEVVSLAVPVAAPFALLASKIITTALKVYENDRLRGELESLQRMLPYVSDASTAAVWYAKMEQLDLKLGKNHLTQLKQLVPLHPVLSAVTTVGSMKVAYDQNMDLISLAVESPEIGRYLLDVIRAKEKEAEIKRIPEGAFTFDLV